MFFREKIVFLIVFLIFHLCVSGQDFTPIVKQFSKKDYNASNQNWSVGQSGDGLMYFGNNLGFLEFDGNTWKINHLPQHKLVRSLLIDRSDRIYTGSFQEFGYFEKDESGVLKYTSLSAKLRNYQMLNDEIWNILDLNGTIIFQSFTSYFTFDGKSVKGFRCPFTFLFFSIYKYQIYSHTNQFGLSTIDYNKAEIRGIKNVKINSPVIGVLNFDASHALLVTKSDEVGSANLIAYWSLNGDGKETTKALLALVSIV